MSVQTTYPARKEVAVAGMLVDGYHSTVVSMINKEASAEIVFGQAVCFEGSTDDQGALSPDNTSDVICGIAIFEHMDPDVQLGDDGVLPGVMFSVLRKGRIWVTVEEAVVPGDRMFIRAVASGAEQEGALRKSSDSSDCIDSTTQGVFLSTAGAGELALLEVDFTNEK